MFVLLGIGRISLGHAANEDEILGKGRLFSADEVHGVESGSATDDLLRLMDDNKYSIGISGTYSKFCDVVAIK